MWYRLANKPIILSNPVVGGFWVGDRFIDYGETFNSGQLYKLLQTRHLNINTQEKLNSFLLDVNRFEIIDGKKIYLKSPRSKKKSLIIPFDFYISKQKIEKDQVFNLNELTKLLKTKYFNINTQEKLNSFLSDPNRFKAIEDKKIYIRNVIGRNKGLIIPFDFYINEQKIEKDQVFNAFGLAKLLQTKYFKIDNQEKLNSFLYNPDRFEIIDGKKIYLKNPQGTKKSLIIPFDFYINEQKIEKDQVFGVVELSKLLQAENININTQEKLNSFLSDPNRFKTIEDKKIYIRNVIGRSKNLIIPFDFYINEQKIEKDQVFSIDALSKLLQSSNLNINTQEKLNSFLSNAEFIIDENGHKKYVRYMGSLREKYINKNLNITNEHKITVESQKPISVLNPKKSIKILKLDFAFVKNGNILLAIEVNGGQHYGFVRFGTKRTYDDWQIALKRDVEKINYCHHNNIPLFIFNHMLPEQYFRTIIDNLNKNPHMYDSYVPQSVIVNDEVNDLADMSLEFIRRQIYSHLYPVFKGVISFDDDISKKRYIKDTLILIAKLLGIYNGGIDKTDYIKAFDANVDLTENYNICLDIYNNLYPDYPLDRDEKITYNDLSVKPKIKKPKEIEEDPLEI